MRQRNPSTSTVTVAVKGCERDAAQVMDATRAIMGYLSKRAKVPKSVSVNMEISPQHQFLVCGKVGKS